MTARNTDTRPATEAWTDMGRAMTQDVAELFCRELAHGTGYRVACEAIAMRFRCHARTIQRHVARAREAGLL